MDRYRFRRAALVTLWQQGFDVGTAAQRARYARLMTAPRRGMAVVLPFIKA